MKRLELANRLHGDAFARSGGDKEVTASLLANQLAEGIIALREIESEDWSDKYVTGDLFVEPDDIAREALTAMGLT